MEQTVIDLFQLNENSHVTCTSTSNKTPYVSLIKINGKPILPPLIDDEKRKEIQNYKKKAIEMELKFARQKKKNVNKFNQISSEITPITNVRPSRQSTPTRPATLNLSDKYFGKTFVLAKSRTEGSLNKYVKNLPVDYEFVPSQKISFKSTLEQRLAKEDSSIVKIKSNKYQQSPIIEEQYWEKLVGSDSELNEKRWSPLKIDSINSLKIELPSKDLSESDMNLEITLDENQNTPDTVTQSPSLMRQNSYTLLTPSPALLNFLESQKNAETTSRSQSGRKTWDLTKAKKNWDPNDEISRKSSDEELDDHNLIKKNSSSLDSFSALNNDPAYNEYSMPNSLEYDSGASPEFYTHNSAPKLAKFKCKTTRKKVRSVKNVPLLKPVDKVPLKVYLSSSQTTLRDSVPTEVKNELSDLSNLLLKMKVDFERQKKELEEKQQSEMKKLENIFQRREAELLSKIRHLPKKLTKSIYSLSSMESPFPEPDSGMMGDGNQNRPVKEKSQSVNENCLKQFIQRSRPHSAKDFHPQYYPYENESRKTKSMDFNEGNQDTDLDISFQEDFMLSKDTILNNEYAVESDSISNFSSRSSTVSSDNKLDFPTLCNLKKFQGITDEEFAKINQAATVITSAARGFLTRRLLRTAHVQGLITTLRDAINCATQLHSASDIADSDIDLMRRLGRQIEAAWDAVYAVFFNTEISTKLQLIAADRERLKAAISKTPIPNLKNKRISSATKKSLDRKKVASLMSKSQTSNGFSRVKTCTKMATSYPSPHFSQKLK